MSNNFEEQVSEVAEATGVNRAAADKIVKHCYSTVGEYDFGFCIDRIGEARIRLMIQLEEENEERLSKLYPPFWRR